MSRYIAKAMRLEKPKRLIEQRE